MSLEELQDQGVLLPEDEWGEHHLTTTVSRWGLLAALLVAAGALALAYLGDGGGWTWAGVALFLVAFFAATVLCDRAVERQRERTEAERREARSSSRPDRTSANSDPSDLTAS